MSNTVIDRMGVASTWIQAVAYSPQPKSGMRSQPMPLARSRWMVTMKLTPVRMDENPRMNTPATAADTLVVVVAEKGT